MTNSPLGQYAPAVAAIVAIGVIGAWVISEILVGLGVFSSNPAGLKEVALIAVGAVFGSAVAVNGYKPGLAAAHQRLDAINAPPASGQAEG